MLVFLVVKLEVIKLENDYTAVVTNKASNKPVTGFFLIAKNFYFAFDFK